MSGTVAETRHSPADGFTRGKRLEYATPWMSVTVQGAQSAGSSAVCTREELIKRPLIGPSSVGTSEVAGMEEDTEDGYSDTPQ